MAQNIALISLLVLDYDDAIRFYTEKLKFTLVEDSQMSDTKRWVIVSPPGSASTSLLLAKAVGPDQQSRVGDQTGGRVFLFLHTDDFYRDYHRMIQQGVEFVREPVHEPYGIVAVFKDLYGNLFDLIQPLPD